MSDSESYGDEIIIPPSSASNSDNEELKALEDTSSEEDFDEETILRACDSNGIFIRRVLKSHTTKNGKIKKNDRLHNSYQYCTFCEKLVSNFTQHTVRQHWKKKKVKSIIEKDELKERQRLFTLMRLAGNHEHNLKIISVGRGELLLERRPEVSFAVKDYGPCPMCNSWMLRKLLWKHQKICVNHADKICKLTTSEIVTQSDVLSKKISISASKKLVNEVFTKMKRDEIGMIAREDKLIIAFGNQWMEKNIGNKLKRGKYTSQIMRLHARFLFNLRQIAPHTSDSLWDYLTESNFDNIVKATLVTASVNVEDEEDLEKPSNAKKLGFDIKRSVNIKIGLSVIEKDQESKAEAENLKQVMSVFWGTKVAKLARCILEERHFNSTKELPKPEDLEKLARVLNKQVTSLDLTDTSAENFKEVALVTSAKLTLYNRRRSGEMETIR